MVRAVRAADGLLHRWARGPYESTLAITALVVLAAASPVFAICAAFDWLFGGRVAASREFGTDVVPLLVAGAAIALCALGLLRLCRFERRITERQTLTALVLGSFAAVAAIAIAHLATGAVAPTAFATAFAEAAATVTGTNSTTISGDDLGGGMLALRAVGQWLGGAAFIVVLVRVLPHLGVGGLDTDGGVATRSARRLAPRSAGTMGRLLLLYGVLTVLVAAGFALAGMPLLQSGLHALTTASTGGFSTQADSLGAFDSAAIEWVAIFGMAAGGVSLPLMFLAIRRRDPARFIRSYEFRLYITLIVFAFVAVALWTPDNFEIMHVFDHEHVRGSLFSVVSAISTTGFEGTNSVFELSVGGRAMLMVLMLIGGMSASMAGGFKVVRLLTLASFIGRELRRAIYPSLAERLRLGRSTISETTISRITGELLLAALLIIPASIVLGASGLDIVEALTYAVSTLSNVGPAMAAVDPSGNVAAVGSTGHLTALNWLGHITAGLLMLCGRMSVTATAVALSVAAYPAVAAVRHGQWRRRRPHGVRVR